jgi:hypothetical protein
VPFSLDTSSSNNSQVVLFVPTKDLVAWLVGPAYAATCPLVPSVKELEALQPQVVLDAERVDMAPLQHRITACINQDGALVLQHKVGGGGHSLVCTCWCERVKLVIAGVRAE